MWGRVNGVQATANFSEAARKSRRVWSGWAKHKYKDKERAIQQTEKEIVAIKGSLQYWLNPDLVNKMKKKEKELIRLNRAVEKEWKQKAHIHWLKEIKTRNFSMLKLRPGGKETTSASWSLMS